MQTHAKPEDGDCMLEGSAKEIPEHGDIDFHIGDDGALNHSFDEIDQYEEAEFEEPRVKVALSWHDVTISAEEKRGKSVETKTILNKISGCVMPGQFLSIIGASGAGKTTLLNHLSSRLVPQNLKITGAIKVNGVEKSKVEGYSEFTAYVQQDDVPY